MPYAIHQTNISDSRCIPTVPYNKHSNTQTDPLEDILKHISSNPMVFANAHTTSNSHNTQCHQQTKITQQGRAENNSQQGNKVINNNHIHQTINAPEENGTAQQKKWGYQNKIWANSQKTRQTLIYTSHMHQP